MENRSQVKRNVQLICNVEQNVADLAWRSARLDSTTMSNYLRTLIVADLSARGLLETKLVEEVA